MTRKNNTLKTKLLIIFTVICMVCSSAFFFTACGKKDIVDPTYSFTESTSSTTTSEPNYTFAIEDADTKTFPLTSVTGFTKSVDNSANSSSVNSGIIDVSGEGYVKTIKNLLTDTDFAKYIERNFKVNNENATVDKIKAFIKSLHDENYEVSNDEVAEYVVENFYTNPKRDGGDDFVYMLNNIRDDSNAGLGTAQKLYLSSSKTLEAGKIYKFSVWVKTVILNAPAGEEYNGANLRITNSVNSISQSDYKINNIIADDWTQYSFYIVADAFYNCTANLIMGLGYGNGANTKTKEYVEGTVYFDDVVFEEVDALPNDVIADTVKFGSTDLISPTLYDIDGVNTFAYDLNYDTNLNYSSDFTLYGDYTKSKIKLGDEYIDSTTYNPNSSATLSENDGIYTAELYQASYTVNFNKDNYFSLNGGEYGFITLSVKNQLKSFGSTSLTVNVYDIYNGVAEKREAIKSYTSSSDEWTKIELLFKNNFVNDMDAREFYFEIVIGPTDIASIEYNSEFATGTVLFKDFKYFNGTVDNPDNSREKTIFSQFVKIADASTALYANYINDYTEVAEEEESYSFNVTPGDIGCISYQPASVSGYEGITYEHAYINKEFDNYEINTRTGKGENGSFAGLINTKYLSNYDPALSSVATALADDYDAENNIQPIMIYNNEEDSYGFVGAQKSLSANSYAKISVTLKVYGDANAFVYLINTADKQIMSFEDFTVNTDYGTVKSGTEISGQDKLLFFNLVEDDMIDGWLTVTFYVASGITSKNFRVEVWNGSRDGVNKSEGFVFIKEITLSTSSAFSEPDKWSNAFSQSGNPLFDIRKSNIDESIVYKRNLTATEKQFNKEYPDQAVEYPATYVWAKSSDTIYAVYNTLDVNETNPYNNVEKDDTSKSGCTTKTDSSTFWMSFSSIVLAVVLILAIIALAIKTFRRKHGKGKNNAKSQYQVKSRISTHKENQKIKEDDKSDENTNDNNDDAEKIEEQEQPNEETVEQEETDGYVYGDVQDFGDKTEETPVEESTEEVKEETPVETPVEEAKEETPAETPVEEAKEEAPAETPVEEVKEETSSEEKPE